MFAEVAIPLYVFQTFTYSLPPTLAAVAKPGCRVLVPFGKQLLTAYIVAIHEDFSVTGVDKDTTSIKPVEQLFDIEPLVNTELLELTKWIADYYFAPWGEVIKASLPTGINAEAETYATITSEGKLEAGSSLFSSNARATALAFILENGDDSGSVSLKALTTHLGTKTGGQAVRELEKAGLIALTRRVIGAVVKPRKQQAVRFFPERLSEAGKLTEAQSKIIGQLTVMAEPPALAELLEAAQVSASAIKTLEKKGIVEVFVREVRRDPLAHIRSLKPEVLPLMPQQQQALDAITERLQAESYGAFLLHGVTGSGKTEVYIRAMREALEKGKSALMLVPEISLTPMFARRLAAHFGDAVAILHSSLSDGERLDEWNRMRSGHARICIGARSGVFAPLENLGLVIVDEEHEGAYKQDSDPRYHGRDTAIMRAVKANAVIVLGSATPSMESYYNAKSGKYTYLEMSQRVSGRPLASVEVVDMREVFKAKGKTSVFADEVLEAITANFERGEQTLVLLNRRGYSAFLVCRSCGHKSSCPNCDVTLTYHKAESRLICHYCGHQARVPAKCESCGGGFIFYVGEGTEQLETMLKEQFPKLRISRLDRDTTRRRGSFEKLLGEFAAGDIDLMVGTQMIAKGHDFHNVTLVCVISVDAGLAMPDFRSAERTFQLLTQVAGRAGRGDKPGKVLLQSYHPEHYSLTFAREQSYEKFYDHEIEFRRQMRYPPFVALINVLIHDKDFTKASTVAADFAKLMKESDKSGVLRVLGPAPAPLARVKGEHRVQVLIKTSHRKSAREALDHAVAGLKERGLDQGMLNIEVDPVNLM